MTTTYKPIILESWESDNRPYRLVILEDGELEVQQYIRQQFGQYYGWPTGQWFRSIATMDEDWDEYLDDMPITPPAQEDTPYEPIVLEEWESDAIPYRLVILEDGELEVQFLYDTPDLGPKWYRSSFTMDDGYNYFLDQMP